MTLLPGLAAAVLLVWALGGNLAQIVTIRFRWTALLYAAFAGQLVAFGPVRVLGEAQIEQVQIASYALLILFCLANRHQAGIWLVTCGVVANALVICVNGGVMPVEPHAIVASGWTVEEYASAYPNIVAHAGAPLWFLGDVFAMPRFHGSAVLSIGDLLIIAGAWLVLQRATSPSSARWRGLVSVPSVLSLAACSLLTVVALAVGPHSLVEIAFGIAGGTLAPAVLSASPPHPPIMRCVPVCAILCVAAIILSTSISSYPTTVLAAATAGLLLGISILTMAARRARRPDLGLVT
jgi:Family of unknown function (DUF5317)